MIWFFAILIVLALGGIALVASGHGAGLAPVHDDRSDVTVPADRELSGDDLRRMRFTTTVRGYRMSEVDELLSRLARELEEREAENPGDSTSTEPPDLPLSGEEPED